MKILTFGHKRPIVFLKLLLYLRVASKLKLKNFSWCMNITVCNDVITRDAKKHVFFQTMFFMQKKVFFIEKNSFLMFFSITGRFLINYSAIRVYL